MKLRDHPLMSYHGVRNWPPVWTHTKDKAVKTVKGEVGVLVYVHSNVEVSSRCYIVVDYEGEMYVGTLNFDNHAFCKLVSKLLNSPFETAHQKHWRFGLVAYAVTSPYRAAQHGFISAPSSMTLPVA